MTAPDLLPSFSRRGGCEADGVVTWGFFAPTPPRRGGGKPPPSRYCVVSRETLFQSPVALTPYHDEERIDEAALADIIDDAYAQAGLHPDQIDSGGVILTGGVQRRQDSQAVSQLL